LRESLWFIPKLLKESVLVRVGGEDWNSSSLIEGFGIKSTGDEKNTSKEFKGSFSMVIEGLEGNFSSVYGRSL
jgi:hypothetical protein